MHPLDYPSTQIFSFFFTSVLKLANASHNVTRFNSIHITLLRNNVLSPNPKFLIFILSQSKSTSAWGHYVTIHLLILTLQQRDKARNYLHGTFETLQIRDKGKMGTILSLPCKVAPPAPQHREDRKNFPPHSSCCWLADYIRRASVIKFNSDLNFNCCF